AERRRRRGARAGYTRRRAASVGGQLVGRLLQARETSRAVARHGVATSPGARLPRERIAGATALFRLHVSRNGLDFARGKILDDTVHHGRGANQRLDVVELLDHVLGMLAGKAREVVPALRIGAVTYLAGRNPPLGDALVEDLLALGDQRRVVAAPGCRRLRCVVSRDAGDDRLVEIARDAPHEIVGILLAARARPEGVDLRFQVALALGGEDGEFRR